MARVQSKIFHQYSTLQEETRARGPRTFWQKHYLPFLAGILLAVAPLGLLLPQTTHAASHHATSDPPLALVYKDDQGPAGCSAQGDAPSCADAAADMLRNSHQHFTVTFVGPGGVPPTLALLQSAALYVQPGGGDSLQAAYDDIVARYPTLPDDLQTYIKSGGRYLGLCMGGYLAGQYASVAEPGFNLLNPGDSDQYTALKNSTVYHNTADTIVDVTWEGQSRQMYFQDGPYFKGFDLNNITVLARYTNSEDNPPGTTEKNSLAVLVAPSGRGKIGVSGPHPEAPLAWYEANHLDPIPGLNVDLANKLLDTLMLPD